MPAPNIPWVWQCVGMLVGVYGLAYACAARSPLRHWPVVLAGLVGKVLGPVGFLAGALQGAIPWRFGWILVANDLIWWVPFAGILLCARRRRRQCGGVQDAHG